ncbi:TCTP family protein [Aspergillus pseudonomiae]|nr:TCTP family protein [Aspergillus pseudonomiae]
MIIYKDIFSDDELVSDTFDLKEVEGVLFECDCKNITKKANEDIQLEGANPSAEGGDEDAGGDDGTIQVLDIVDQFRLQEYPKMSKDDYKKYIKGYMKKVLSKLEETKASKETIDEFKKGAPAAVKKIVANCGNYDFFVGESFDAEAMLVLIDYREDGVTPYATLWKHGLKEMKV